MNAPLPREKKTEKIEAILWSLNDCPCDEACKRLRQSIKDVEDFHGKKGKAKVKYDSFVLQIRADDEGEKSLYICGIREENDVEYQRRVTLIAQQEIYRRQQYESLKKEFEPPK